MATSTGVPPKPKKAPTVHLKGASRKPPRTLKSDLRKLKEKANSARSKWVEGREAAKSKEAEVRKDAAEILEPVKERVAEEKKLAGEVVEPVLKVIGSMRGVLDPKNGRTKPYVTSFLLSSALSWVAGPQLFVAAYDRIVLLSGRTLISPAHDASVLAAGQGSEWGIMNGPGRWFRDTLAMAGETNQMGSLIWAVIIGLLPMLILSIRNISTGYLSQATHVSRLGGFALRWLNRLPYLVPLVFLTGVAYPDQVTAMFGSPWVLELWLIWIAGLFCIAYYFTMWVFDRVEKRLPLGATHILLMMPLASIVTGFLLNAPDAAW